jgi:hypothetical protein
LIVSTYLGSFALARNTAHISAGLISPTGFFKISGTSVKSTNTEVIASDKTTAKQLLSFGVLTLEQIASSTGLTVAEIERVRDSE